MLESNVGLVLLGVLPCCMLTGGSQLNGACTGVDAAVMVDGRLDAWGGMLICCSPVSPAVTEHGVILSLYVIWQ